MPSFNRARQFGSGNGLRDLLAGIFGYLGETGVVENQEQGPTSSGRPIAQKEPFRATNWLARPNAARLNQEYLLNLKAGEDRLKHDKELEILRTDEGIRSRKLGLPLLADEEYNRASGTNRAFVEREEKLEPLNKRNKQFDQNAAVLQAAGIPVTDENIASFNNILTNPKLNRLLQETTLGEMDAVAKQGQLKQSENIRLLNADADEEIASLGRVKARKELEGDIDVLPTDIERRKKMNRYAPESVRTGIARESTMLVPEGGMAYDINTGKSKFSRPAFSLETFGGTTPTPDGGYTGKVTQNTPDTVTNINQPIASGKSDWVINSNTGEAVNIITGKRIKLNP